MRVLGLVPARSGSKGVPGKNLRLLGGRPLLEWTADSARASQRLSRLVLSTEDAEIADVGRTAGLETPFVRPPELAADTTPMLDVVQHALATLASDGDRFDAVCLLQPTSPFRQPGDIDRCVDRLVETDADAVVTVLAVPADHNPHWVYERDAAGSLRLATGESEPIARRQDLPPAYHREGSVYVTRTEVIVAGSLYGDRVVGVEIEPARSVNIDDEDDLLRAEQLVRERD